MKNNNDQTVKIVIIVLALLCVALFVIYGIKLSSGTPAEAPSTYTPEVSDTTPAPEAEGEEEDPGLVEDAATVDETPDEPAETTTTTETQESQSKKKKTTTAAAETTTTAAETEPTAPAEPEDADETTTTTESTTTTTAPAETPEAPADQPGDGNE